MVAVALAALAHAVFARDEDECSCNQPPPPPPPALACLDGAFDGPTGTLKMLRVPVEWPGRITVGDLDHDGIPDIVVARRHALAAYNVCGKQLWKKANRADWDNVNVERTAGHDEGHVYHNWTSFGWIGDANGDGTNEYMNIAEDRRTLIIRDSATGKVEVGFDLGPGQWRYVMVAKMADGSPRVFVTAKPGRLKMKSLDLRDGLSVDWSVDHSYRLTHYVPPQVADINADGSDDLYHGSAAVDGRTGALLWRYGFGQHGIGGAHTGSVRQVDPSTPRLETVVSVYSPKSKSEPSLVIVDGRGNIKKSFHGGDHPHAHAVGDFQPNRPGLETFARGDGQDHWMIDKDGNVIANVNLPRLHSRWGEDWGDDAGELIQTIQWNGGPEDELLLVERHVNLRNIPMMAVVGAKPITRVFHGGIDVRRTDPNPLGWYGKVKEISDDGPYEGGAHVVDMIGDGREEVVALAHDQIVVYFNSGDAGVPKKWGDHAYMTRKKQWVQVYNNR